MKNTDQLSELRKKHLNDFKMGEVQYRSFHDLLWQIRVNGAHENEEITFTVDVMGQFGNQLIIATDKGGYYNTGVYFVNENSNDCEKIAESISLEFFGITEEEHNHRISKSMGLTK